MAHDHHDEEVLGKPYDARLVRRLLGYVKPYLRFVVVAVIILVFVAGFELALPYITKLAIDDYIVATARLVQVDTGAGGDAGALALEFIEEHSDDLVPIDGASGGSFLIRSKHLSGYDPRVVARATDAGIIGEGNYYLADRESVEKSGVDDTGFLSAGSTVAARRAGK